MTKQEFLYKCGFKKPVHRDTWTYQPNYLYPPVFEISNDFVKILTFTELKELLKRKRIYK